MSPDLQVGSWWRENDPRADRDVKVCIIRPNGRVQIFCKQTSRFTETDASRFGKKGRIGFTLIPQIDIMATLAKALQSEGDNQHGR